MANGDYDLTHKKILESGKKIFKEQGFEKANLRAICKEAGVTTGAFYGHLLYGTQEGQEESLCG